MLAGYQALIVHFSGTPKGAGADFGDLYPDDLKKVVAGKCLGGLSCSTVMPGDEFADLHRANATGCVGVILGLKSPRSLLDAHPSDCGSRVVERRREFQRARDMTIGDIEETISGRRPESYNEWGVADYVVLGMFAAEPYEIWKRYPAAELGLSDEFEEEVDAQGATNPHEVAVTFAGLPVYSFRCGQLVRYDGGNWTTVAHGDVYAP